MNRRNQIVLVFVAGSLAIAAACEETRDDSATPPRSADHNSTIPEGGLAEREPLNVAPGTPARDFIASLPRGVDSKITALDEPPGKLQGVWITDVLSGDGPFTIGVIFQPASIDDADRYNLTLGSVS